MGSLACGNRARSRTAQSGSVQLSGQITSSRKNPRSPMCQPVQHSQTGNTASSSTTRGRVTGTPVCHHTYGAATRGPRSNVLTIHSRTDPSAGGGSRPVGTRSNQPREGSVSGILEWDFCTDALLFPQFTLDAHIFPGPLVNARLEHVQSVQHGYVGIGGHELMHVDPAHSPRRVVGTIGHAVRPPDTGHAHDDRNPRVFVIGQVAPVPVCNLRVPFVTAADVPVTMDAPGAALPVV